MKEYFSGDIDWRAFWWGWFALLGVMIVTALVVPGVIAIAAGILAGVVVYGNTARE